MGTKCRTTGKIMFGKSGAERTARDMYEKGLAPHPLRVYKCNFCHKYHMSSIPKTRQEKLHNERIIEDVANRLAQLRKRNKGT